MILTVATSKGGSAKTTTAAALLQAAAARSLKVLGVDMDPQSNLTVFLAGDRNMPGVRDALHGEDAGAVIQTTPQGIDLMAACTDLAAEATSTGSAKRLGAALDPVRNQYDVIIIDTPPTIGELVFNALVAADAIIIPLECDISNLQGLCQIIEVVQQMGRAGPRIIGSVITRYDRRPKVNRYMRDRIQEAAADAGAPLIGTVRQCTAVRETQMMQASLYQYSPRCNAAKDYDDLLTVLMEV